MKKKRKISAKRLCKVIEAITSFVGEDLSDKPEVKLAQEIYRIAHLAGNCGQSGVHDNWIEDFIKLETSLKKGNII